MSIDNERGGTTGGSRIVVGVDGSPSSEQALRWAAEQARLTGQELHAVITWEFPVTYGALPVPDGVDWAEESRAILQKTVANALPDVEARQVVQHVVHGAPDGRCWTSPKVRTCSSWAAAATAGSPACCSAR
jgi:nucleotide-binding universal stress UspA family protein